MQTVQTIETTQPKRVQSTDDDTLLTSAQTRARVGGVSTMCIWRWMRDPRVRFPAPVKINGRNYWRLGVLRQWQAQRVTKAAAYEKPQNETDAAGNAPARFVPFGYPNTRFQDSRAPRPIQTCPPLIRGCGHYGRHRSFHQSADADRAADIPGRL